MRPSPGEKRSVNHHAEMVENHHVIGIQSPVLRFERRVILATIAGDITAESQRNFAGIHHVAENGNLVVPTSFLR